MMTSVLLIDPDEDSREIYSLFLERSGYRFLTAQTVEDGVRVARSVRPSVIVTELFTRTAGGWRILDSLRACPETTGIPIIALSAYGIPEAGETTRLADVFLPKPCRGSRLLAEVARLCPAPGSPAGHPRRRQA